MILSGFSVGPNCGSIIFRFPRPTPVANPTAGKCSQESQIPGALCSFTATGSNLRPNTSVEVQGLLWRRSCSEQFKKPIGFFTENMLRSSQSIEINAIDTPCQDAWQTSGNLDDDVWNTSPLPDFNSTSNRYCPASTFIYAHVPPEAVKLLLPEVYHPHTQKMCTIYGIPFPICIRNVVVPFPSEVDAWNIYYFAEDPDVTPYSAGLTCIPDLH
ncbi:hypothetical protein JOM56_007167 [Amanita muscaria]